ncbi:hypothetical protein ABT009_30520 [Streptomyces sp. NPDC002896]|uniref:hypothetical protein n=1 Tax=Streptomyces sp. NPDC002896 TaxID=3154438 RepID=UPI00331792B7
MSTERRRVRRLLMVMLTLLLSIGGGLATAPTAMADYDPDAWHVDWGGEKPYPKEWEGDRIGQDKGGNWCNVDKLQYLQRQGKALGETCIESPDTSPGWVDPCEHSECKDEERQKTEMERLEHWRETQLALVRKGEVELADYDKWNKFLTKCIKDGGLYTACKQEAYKKYGPMGGDSLSDWVGGQISKIARDALEEAAQYIGNAVVWLLEEFADIFNEASVINLDSTGIAEPMGIATALSAVIAVFLLLLQFGKVAISHQGGHAATAISGLAKWVVISTAYWTVTTTALQLSDEISTWIINWSFDGGGNGGDAATAAMKAQFGKMFGGLIAGGAGASAVGGALITGQGLAASAVAVVIVIGIVCILAIGALWIEMLLRQAGIMILVATMPIVLVGQMSEATKDWWPKARDALLALILMKPMIVFCFAIGFFAIKQGEGVQNMIVGLVIFLMACFCWPVLAKFMTFSTLGAGAAVAGGLMSSLGSSASSMSGGYRPELGGAGAVGGGPAYTRALERDNAQTQATGSNAQGSGGFWTNESLKARMKGPGGRLGTRVAGPLGLGLQAVAMGKDTLESGMANTAAHAGLDHASLGGRHVVIAPRGPDTASLPPTVQERALQSRPDAAPVVTGPANTDIPSPREG